MELLDDDIMHVQRDENEIRNLKISVMDELKSLKQGRVTTLVMIGFTILGIVIGLFMSEDVLSVLIEGIILLGVFIWGFWYSAKGPKIAFIVVLSIYWLHTILTFMVSAENGARGVIVKVILTIYLVKAILACNKFAEVREKLKNYGEPLEIPSVLGS